MRQNSPGAPSLVLVHGYHVDAEQWEEVVWGRPAEGRLGRVPRAVLLALEHPDPVLLFGTGAAARDGLLESEHTLEFARSRCHELEDLARRVLPSTATTRIGELLHERSRCERTSTTTGTEVAAGFETALSLGAGRLTLVSSPTHVARCHQTALTLLATTPRYAPLAGGLAAVASDTTVAGRGPGDVVVLEPRTRTTGAVEFSDVARAALPLLEVPEAAAGYAAQWQELTRTWLARAGGPDGQAEATSR